MMTQIVRLTSLMTGESEAEKRVCSSDKVWKVDEVEFFLPSSTFVDWNRFFVLSKFFSSYLYPRNTPHTHSSRTSIAMHKTIEGPSCFCPTTLAANIRRASQARHRHIRRMIGTTHQPSFFRIQLKILHPLLPSQPIRSFNQIGARSNDMIIAMKRMPHCHNRRQVHYSQSRLHGVSNQPVVVTARIIE